MFTSLTLNWTSRRVNDCHHHLSCCNSYLGSVSIALIRPNIDKLNSTIDRYHTRTYCCAKMLLLIPRGVIVRSSICPSDCPSFGQSVWRLVSQLAIPYAGIFCPPAISPLALPFADPSVRRTFRPPALPFADPSIQGPFCPLAFLLANYYVCLSFRPPALPLAGSSVCRPFPLPAILSAGLSV